MAAARLMIRLLDSNRRTEDQALAGSKMPSRLAMAWHIVHIRDDIASATGTLGMIAGLLGAILALLFILTVVIIFRAFA